MLRITGGEFRGRMIQAPSGTKTRPTQARLRQALFNSLQADISGARVLDLFAGSGALALEALSWGAERAVLIEDAKPAIKIIEKNIATLGVGNRVRVVTDPLPEAVERVRAEFPFDIVLADPPYAEDWELRLLNELPWTDLLKPGGKFCLEWGVQKSLADTDLPERVGPLVKVRDRPYGESALTTYRRES